MRWTKGTGEFGIDKKKKDVETTIQISSFYHTTKSLLVLFQIMGVMPIHRNPRGIVASF
jgi:gustatory receptor